MLTIQIEQLHTGHIYFIYPLFSLLKCFKAYPRHDVISTFHTSVCFSTKYSHFLT